MKINLKDAYLYNEAAESLYQQSRELLEQNEVAQADLCEGAADRLKDLVARAWAEAELKKASLQDVNGN